MLLRAVFLLLLLSVPFEAQAAGYIVRPGDTLASIAERHHVSVGSLARANSIRDVNLIQVGRVLVIPVYPRTFTRRVRWGDTLIGIAARFHLTLSEIHRMNPALGPILLAGQWLRLCSPCAWATATVSPGSGFRSDVPPTAETGSTYVVQPGDSLIAIANRFGVTVAALLAANHLEDPDRIVIGSDLLIPAGQVAPYDPWMARSLIAGYAREYGIEPSLPLAVGWQESGFNQAMTSRTGAEGVMQVEPYTGAHIARLLGRPFNLRNVNDNIHAGVFWLARLIAYYAGNERLAVAAYYQGTRSIARDGFFRDTVQYVNDVMSLKAGFGG